MVNKLSNKEFMTMGIKLIDPSKFENIKNRELSALCKPNGGLWASPVNFNGEYETDWIKFCLFNGPDWLHEDCVKFKLKEDSNILVIDSNESLLYLFNNYSRKIELPENLKVLQSVYDKNYIDFELLSRYYDGMYLDFDWYRSFRLDEFVNLDFSYLFSLWDVTSLLLFNLDCIESQTYYKLDVNSLLCE